MPLFSDVNRTNEDAAAYGESHYDYLNRSGRPEFEAARLKLEVLFSAYKKMHPESADDLEKRIKSPENNHHLGAITELYVHNLLNVNGFTLTPHPQILGKSSRPDFLGVKDGQEIYIEVTSLIGGQSSIRTSKFEGNILDTINQLYSPDFLISVDFEVTSSQKQPATGKIKKTLQKFIDSLNYDQVCREFESNKNLPSIILEENDWKIKFTATPVKEDARERRKEDGTRSIGYIAHQARMVDADDVLREKIKEKRKKYGKLSKPLLIAVNTIYEGIFTDDYTVMCALFGKEVIHFTTYRDGSQKTSHGRNLEGAWIEPSGKVLSGVSGVLILPGLYGWNTDKIAPKLWLHPRPNHALVPGCIAVTHKVHDKSTDRMEETDYGPSQ